MNQGKEEMTAMEEHIERLRQAKVIAALGGGQEKTDRLRKQGKLTARELIELLLDPGSFTELDMLVGYAAGMPGDGIVAGYGTIDSRTVCVFAHDPTVLGGSMGYLGGRKMYKTIERALVMGVPVIGLMDSPGSRVVKPGQPYSPYSLEPGRQSDEKKGGGVFYVNTLASGVIPQISAILGNCAGIPVYSAALTDFIFMVDGIGHMFITGPGIVKAATGEEVSYDELGGAKVHCQFSGVADLRVQSERECAQMIRKLLWFLPSNCRQRAPRIDTGDDPERPVDVLADIVPTDCYKFFDMYQVVNAVVDNGDFFELKPEFAGEIIVGFARLDGEVVGIVANQPMVRAGCLTVDSSDKQARFIRFCDSFNIPIILLIDTPAYLPGKAQERAGIIRHGAKVLYALCESVVPKIAVVIRKVYGGGNLGMGVLLGQALDLIFAWPIAEFGTMGAEQAVELYFAEEIKAARDPSQFKGEKIREYREHYSSPLALASECMFIHDIIEPRDTRRHLIKSLRLLKDKRVDSYPKRHGNIPL
jgi:acetyl-CoA carboxylase carboxyltransferase component